MLVYFFRHGETMWNREKRIQGSTPHIDLTDNGVRLAEATRDGFAARGIRFDCAYTSPLRRAAHTAEIIAGDVCPIIADDRLREMGFGKYEGTRIGDGLWADDNIRRMFTDTDNYVPPPGAESLEAVAARIRDFLENEIAPLEGRCETVLAVSHGGAMRSLVRLIRHLPAADYWRGRQPNCCVHVVNVENGEFSLEEPLARLFADS